MELADKRTRNEIISEILRLIDIASNRKMDDTELRYVFKTLERERQAIAKIDAIKMRERESGKFDKATEKTKRFAKGVC